MSKDFRTITTLSLDISFLRISFSVFMKFFELSKLMYSYGSFSSTFSSADILAIETTLSLVFAYILEVDTK